MSRITNHRTQSITNYLNAIGVKDVTSVTTMFRNAAAIFFLSKGYMKVELAEVFLLHHTFVTKAQELVKEKYGKDKEWTNKFDKEMGLLISKEYLMI